MSGGLSCRFVYMGVARFTKLLLINSHNLSNKHLECIKFSLLFEKDETVRHSTKQSVVLDTVFTSPSKILSVLTDGPIYFAKTAKCRLQITRKCPLFLPGKQRSHIPKMIYGETSLITKNYPKFKSEKIWM